MPDVLRDPLLQEREKTHGSFAKNSNLWFMLFEVIKEDIKTIPTTQQLAFNMMMLKIARAVSNPKVKEHFDDIAGYAKLASEACEI